MTTFLILLIPTLIRLDLVVSCPALTWTKEEQDVTVRRGNDYNKAGVEAQGDWILTMGMLYAPFILLAALI